MKIILSILILLLGISSASAQNRILDEAEIFADVAELLPENVQVNGSTQGFAIYGRYAFSMHDKGQCVIIDLKQKRFVNTFIIEGNTGHCNNASFGVERYSKQSQFPLLYVTECRGERACYVNDISLEGAKIVQKIFYDGEDITGPADWAVDRRHKLIYLYCTVGNARTLKWFTLPRLADSDARGEVHLSRGRHRLCRIGQYNHTTRKSHSSQARISSCGHTATTDKYARNGSEIGRGDFADGFISHES